MRRLHRPTPRAFHTARPCPPGAPPAVSSRASGSTRGHGPMRPVNLGPSGDDLPSVPSAFCGAGATGVLPFIFLKISSGERRKARGQTAPRSRPRPLDRHENIEIPARARRSHWRGVRSSRTPPASLGHDAQARPVRLGNRRFPHASTMSGVRGGVPNHGLGRGPSCVVG